MSIKINHELPIPEVLKNEYPLSNEQKSIKQQRDEEIRRIFTGESDKFVVLVGPCSADNEDTVHPLLRGGRHFHGTGHAGRAARGRGKDFRELRRREAS